jgi:pimeloyl-ACP methyl ester carboxylesterase
LSGYLPAFSVESAPGANPTRTAFVLHGILGSGRNWRTLARRMARAWPDWRFVLVDLRNHGDSPLAPPPQTVRACADDLARLAQQLGGPPEVVIGHSFGGKVTMVYAREHGAALRAAWVLDATPEAAPPPTALDSEVLGVVETLGTLAMPVASRQVVADTLLAAGFSEGLAAWMTTNLQPGEGGFVWRFHLPAVREMLADYWAEDLLPYLQVTTLPVHLVRAGRSDRWHPALLRALEEVSPAVRVHLLEKAGHWLHVDDPEGLLALLAPTFEAPPGAIA